MLPELSEPSSIPPSRPRPSGLRPASVPLPALPLAPAGSGEVASPLIGLLAAPSGGGLSAFGFSSNAASSSTFLSDLSFAPPEVSSSAPISSSEAGPPSSSTTLPRLSFVPPDVSSPGVSPPSTATVIPSSPGTPAGSLDATSLTSEESGAHSSLELSLSLSPLPFPRPSIIMSWPRATPTPSLLLPSPWPESAVTDGPFDRRCLRIAVFPLPAVCRLRWHFHLGRTGGMVVGSAWEKVLNSESPNSSYSVSCAVSIGS